MSRNGRSLPIALPQIGITLTPSGQRDLEDILSLARLADSLGFHSIWIPEVWGTDAVSVMALLARATHRIRIAAGVFNVYSRSAALIAQTAATLQILSHGRFLLGLGVSGPKVIENWHGLPYLAPLDRTRDYVNVIRLALSGQRVDYAGTTLQLQGFKLSNRPETPVPIYIAALGPRNVRLTGEIADGWLPIFAPRGGLEGLRGELESGARSSSRDPASIDVAAYVPAVVGPRAERLLRQQLAYYVGGMGTFYARYLERLGFARDVETVRREWEAGDRRAAVEAVSVEMLQRCTLAQEMNKARDQLLDYAAEGIDTVVLSFPHGTLRDEAEATLRAFAGHLSQA